MADAIDNLAQDLNQANAVDEFPGYPGYKMGDLVPNMAGVRVGDLFYGYDPYGQEAPYNWKTGGFEFKAAPSDVGFGNIDYNVRDQPTERINIKSGDEQDALIRTGIGTPLDPVTQQRYNTTGTTPSPVGGVDYLTPKQIEDLTAGQTPSVSQGVVTRGEPVSIPGKTLPDYIPIGQMENGDVLYADKNNLRDTVIRPSAYSVSQEDLDKGVVPQKFNFGVNTAPSTSQVTPTSVGAYQPVGADQPTTASVGGFDNTGVNVTVGPGVAGPGGTTNVTPGYVPKPEVKPGDEFKDSPWQIFEPTGKDDKLAPYTSPTGEVFPTDQNGYKWNYQTQQFDCVGGKCSEKNPVEDTPKPPVVTPPVVTPPSGGTKPPGGGVQPGTGTGTGTYTGTPLPPREPVTPLVRRETVIPTKGTKEVPLPDRQADPFAKLYADLLANSQQQQDQYRYINYDPDQIMNAAMSGFRRRGAMRSLQGYY
jgi:hypothetical protein